MRCITIYFEVLHRYKPFCCTRFTARTNSAYYSILYLYAQTKHVCDFVTLNYSSMTHCVGIYKGTVAFYRDLTRITVSDIKPEWILHHSTRNNIRKKNRTNRYDALRYISKNYTVTNVSAAFETLQLPIPHIRVYYICIHKLITFVTLLHLITPQ